MKRSFQSGSEKRKKKRRAEEELKKTKPISQFFRSTVSGTKVNDEAGNDWGGAGNENLDADGDGARDENLDADGDGARNENLDADGDGARDENLDADGDGAGNENLDADGDGARDENLDADGDGARFENLDDVVAKDMDENVKGDNVVITLTEDYDVGLYLDKNASDREKYFMISNTWKAPKNFTWPFSEQTQKSTKKKRYFRQEHIDRYPEFSYSKSKNGILCKYCVLSSNMPVSCGILANSALSRYDRLTGTTGDLESHLSKKYHLDAQSMCLSFKRAYEMNIDVLKLQDRSRSQACQRNRELIKPVIETIIFLGQNNLPFRSSSNNTIDLNNLQPQEGLFRRLLRFRVQSGDTCLKTHLEESSKNAVYTSPDIQNQLISCIGQEIRETIIQRVKRARFYIIMADETTDVSSTEQLSLCFR